MRPLALTLLLTACAAPTPAPQADAALPPPDPALQAAVDELYAAFCFDPGTQPDWQAMRDRFAKDAAFAYPIAQGGRAQLMDGDSFLGAFSTWVLSADAQATGFHERIVEVDARQVGRIAHTWVLFEGFEPGTERVVSRGLDSIQWVHDAGTWKVAGFTSQYTEPGLAF